MMSRRLFDVVPQLLNENDIEVHKNRAYEDNSRLKEEFESRKATAAGMFRNRRPDSTVFRIAQIVKLPVMVVREVEAEVLGGVGNAKTTV
jgi:hypothetical protein